LLVIEKLIKVGINIYIVTVGELYNGGMNKS